MLPKAIQKGDTIGIIAPSSPILEEKKKDMECSVAMMQKAGYQIKFPKNVFANTLGYSATVQEKIEDINQMFIDEEVKAIFCATGGNNSNSLFEELDDEIIRKHPKIICGFSDATSILNRIYQETGLITFHGPTFKSLASWETEYSFSEVIERFEKKSLVIGKQDDEYQTIREGKAEGILMGGNLNLFSRMITGSYKLDLKDKILFLEDLGYESEPAAIHSYFYQLKQNKVFQKIKGIWLGNYEHETGFTIEKILIDVIGEANFPIIKSNNFGHCERKTVIPIGTLARIDTSKKTKIELLEECVN